MENKTLNSKEGKRGVFIRGIDREVYSRVVEVARSMGKTIGEVTNEAYKLFIATVEGMRGISRAFMEGVKGVEVIGNIDELEVTGEDLAKLNRKVVFKEVKKLLLKNIDEDTFDKYVEKIVSVNELIVPKELSKLRILAKCSWIGKLIQQ
jgi:hypothetical protein